MSYQNIPYKLDRREYQLLAAMAQVAQEIKITQRRKMIFYRTRITKNDKTSSSSMLRYGIFFRASIISSEEPVKSDMEEKTGKRRKAGDSPDVAKSGRIVSHPRPSFVHIAPLKMVGPTTNTSPS